MRTIPTARGDVLLDRCLVMGIVNRTPDSFFDGGRMTLNESIDHARRLLDDGADLLDVGAVKAGPGEDVSEEEETARLLPLVEALAASSDVPLSVETSRASVAKRALDAGASVVNDVAGLADDDLARVCGDAGAALVVMHHGGQVRGRPRSPRYGDVVAEVIVALEGLVSHAIAQGVDERAIVIDPGLDFGKNTMHSLEIMRRLTEITALDRPVLIAPSRKDVVGETLGLPPEERLEGTLALVVASVLAGAAIVRVHDVLAAQRVVAMTEAVLGRRRPAAPVRGLWD